MATRILWIDDDLVTAQDVQPSLAREGFYVDHALPGRSAIRQVLIDQPDLVILGIGIQEEAWQFCRRLLSFVDQPVLLLLASDDRLDRVRGLDLGADDCMVKPILPVELAARMRALLRREVLQRFRQQHFFVDGDLVVDLTRQEVRRHDEPVALTSTEFRMLWSLVGCEGEVLSHERLILEVWGPEQAERRAAVKQYIHRLRQKLEPDPDHPQRIVTRWGKGYMLKRLAE